MDAAARELANAGLAAKIMIDCSHANSLKQFKRQVEVVGDVAEQIASGDDRIVGVMIESHLVEGKQDLTPGCTLTYGQSITDGCLGWEESVALLTVLAESVRLRRKQQEQSE